MRKIHELLIVLFVLFTTVIGFSQNCITLSNLTNSYTTICPDCYGQNSLSSIVEGNNFQLSLNSNGIRLEILDLSTNVPTNILSSNNNWENLGTQQGAVDIMLTAQAGIDLFCNLIDYPDFIGDDLIANINGPSHPLFGGAYAGNGVINIPVDSNDDYNPEVIAHELGHLIIEREFTNLIPGFDNGGIREGLCDLIGIAVESHLDGSDIDWIYQNRVLDDTPSALYSDSNFNGLSQWIRGEILSYWLFLVQDCFDNFYQSLGFLFRSLDANPMNAMNGIVACNYPTLREATLARYHSENGCDECYRTLVNAWNAVGVGEAYDNNTAPTILDVNIAPCSVSVTWDDNGIPNHLCTLISLDQNITENQCISYQNCVSFNNLPLGTYMLSVEPICGTSCNGVSGPIVIENNIVINGELPTYIIDNNTFSLTDCDIVVGGDHNIPDEGLPDTAYSFNFGGQAYIPTQIFRENGNMYFQFEDRHLPVNIGDTWEIIIDYGCDGGQIFQRSGNFIKYEESIIDFNIEAIRSNCYIQPIITNGHVFASVGIEGSYQQTSVISITTEEFNQITDFSYEANEQLFLDNPVTTSPQIVGGIPFVPIPPNPEVLLIVLSSSRFIPNPDHPFSPDMACYNESFSNVWAIPVDDIGSNCNTQIDPSICIENSLLIINFGLQQAELNEISHIEYSYRTGPNEMWSACNSTISNTIEIFDLMLLSNQCNGALEVDARIICECTQNDLCDNEAWVETGNEVANNNCSPPALDPNSLITFDRCGDDVTVLYREPPGAFSYRFYYMEIEDPDILAENPMITCNQVSDCPNGVVLEFPGIEEYFNTGNRCPYQSNTGRLRDVFTNPDAFYLIQIETVCCDGMTEPTCDRDGNLVGAFNVSDCRFSFIVGPVECVMDETQELQVTVTNSTNISATWIDMEPGDYVVSATPINSNCSNQIISTGEIVVSGTTVTAELSGLLPESEYNILVTKDCSALACNAFTSSISTTITTGNNITWTTEAVCLDEPGEIRVHFPNGLPLYLYTIDDVPRTENNATNEIIFEIETAGEYIFYIDECEDLKWIINVEDEECTAFSENCDEDNQFYDKNYYINATLPNQNSMSSLISLGILPDTDYFYYNRFVIIGELIIDVNNTSFSNCLLEFEEGGSLIIDGSFESSETTYKACGDQWDGIKSNGPFTIYFTYDNVIENALTGMDFKNGVEVFNYDTEFNNCEIGMELNNTEFNNISDCTFNCVSGIITRGTDPVITRCSFLEYSNKGVQIITPPVMPIIHDCTFSTIQSGTSYAIECLHAACTQITETVINTPKGIHITHGTTGCALIDGCSISTIDQSIESQYGGVIVSDNSIIQSETKTAIEAKSGWMLIQNNDIMSDQSALSSVELSGMTFSSLDDNDIRSLKIDGSFSTYISANEVYADNIDAVHLFDTPAAELTCNNISGSSIGLNMETFCNNTVLTANNFDAEVDLWTLSTINNFNSAGDTEEKGNCFDGIGVVANLPPDDLRLSTFIVDSQENPCYLPANVSPADWFDNMNSPDVTTADCIDNSNIGYNFGSGLENESIACAYMDNVTQLMNNPQTKNQGIVRMINFLKLLRKTPKYQENSYPKCVTQFLDSTQLCGLKMILDVDELFTEDTKEMKIMRQQMHVQSIITMLSFKLWEQYDVHSGDNTQVEKDALQNAFITERISLLSIHNSYKAKQDDNDEAISSWPIEECIDSISLLKINAYKYIAHHESLSEEERYDIDRCARLCPHIYGHAISLYRNLASEFNDIDYSSYDEYCSQQPDNNEDVEPRHIKTLSADIHIYPNPNNGLLFISCSDTNIMETVSIYHITGQQVSEHVIKNNHATIDVSNHPTGIYMLQCINEDKSTSTHKLIIQ